MMETRHLLWQDGGLAYVKVWRKIGESPVIEMERGGQLVGEFHPLSGKELLQCLQKEPILMEVDIEDGFADYAFRGVVVDPKNLEVTVSFRYHTGYVADASLNKVYIDLRRAAYAAIASYCDDGGFRIITPPREKIVMRGVKSGYDIFTVIFVPDGTYSVNRETKLRRCLTERLRITQSDFQQQFYRVKGWISDEHWCGKEDYILSRVVLPTDYKEIEGDFAINDGKLERDDLPNIEKMVRDSWTTPPVPEHKLEDTKLLRRVCWLGYERAPAMLFKHPSGRLVPISYKEFPLFDGLDLYQAEEGGPISGYKGDELVFLNMPLNPSAVANTKALLQYALEEEVGA